MSEAHHLLVSIYRVIHLIRNSRSREHTNMEMV